MGSELEIRPAEDADIPALSVLAKETFFDTFTGTCTDEDMAGFLVQYYDEAVLRRDTKESEYFLVMVGASIAGYFSMKAEHPDFPETAGHKSLELKRFYLQKDYHSKGIAQLMMNFVIDKARNEGYTALFLGVWEFNFRAQKFYSKFGFQLTNHRHDFPIGSTPQTDVYMVKTDLNSASQKT